MHHRVHLDVVGVAVPAMPVVTDDDVGGLFVEDVGEPLARFGEVGAVERLLASVLLPPHHAGVGTIGIVILALVLDLILVGIGRLTIPRGIRA